MTIRKKCLAACCNLFIGLTPLTVMAAAPSEKYTVPGLTKPVEIIRDHWGISHIYADNENDLFFAQGYNAARDRLFELEMWRRQATGTVADPATRAIPEGSSFGSRCRRTKNSDRWKTSTCRRMRLRVTVRRVF